MPALKDKKDNRDYCFEALGTRPLTDKDWEDGFDIEKELGFKIPVKNQFSSSSCVGQAFAYYLATLLSKKNRRHREVSAKSIYSLIALGNNRGAYLRDGAKTIHDLGALWENLLRSYRDNGTSDEAWLTDKSWFNDEIKDIMALLKVSDYYRVTDFSMDGFAKAIRDGYGMVAGVNGTNNGTWHSAEPKPPETQAGIWGHAMFFGRFGTDDKGRYVEALNSWGNIGRDGWQKLREEWFTENGEWIFNPWILTNNTNNMNEAIKVLKDANSSAVGFWLPAISEDVMKSYALNFGIEVPMKHLNNGITEIDWDNFINGEITFK